ncbi:unnamed protein product [Rhizoctonia solani]|uniref:Zn(2)-C6 fungal-type domain-containing protein n=1 Tax=Rhizoctonia solani TaxID=456999 RepID=A0A8H3D647_9AGAM|nr:unnamed protein product [Rhizoctonia solani]
MSYRLPPGPVGTSCLTCKRRHKKCDRGKPACNRCLKGGYECLGYDHNKSAEDTRTTGDDTNLPPDPPRVIRSSPFPLTSPTTSTSTNSVESSRDYDEPLIPNDTLAALGIYDSHAGIRRLVSSNPTRTPQHIFNTLAHRGTDAAIPDEPPPIRPEIDVAETTLFLSPDTTSTVVSHQPVSPFDPLLSALASQIPRNVPLSPELSGIIEYVISRVDRILDATYFRPQGRQIANFRADIVWRLSTCDFARQGLVIYAKIRNSILDGTDSSNGGSFIRWIDGHEQVLSTSLDRSLTPYEHQERHHDVLEMFYVKVAIFNATATYKLMCRLAPTFFQAVYSDPVLWPAEHNPALVSIAYLLACARYGPVGYMLMDVMASMAYGVPHIVTYDADTELFHTEPHPAEWMNCFPGEFLLMLARINICRDQGLLAVDWQDIEGQLVTWEARPKYKPEGLDSGKSVAWLALQETWRQTLLIYLYLALCGVRTDDPRIQSSLRQIFQIIGTIKRQDLPLANVHLFAQYLIVSGHLLAHRKAKEASS